ncbi:hypothetical protein [Epibacterium ulvae]|uniref:hypothetical protein n=1 Tax=Epibacterium ulvae TaxID=1156985 RepID=UPI0024917F94|nr:hypothetical protein [Epibacterium ulvae]
MLLATVKRHDRDDQIISIDQDLTTFGSGFDVDVTLMDDGVAPYHFLLERRDQDVILQMATGCTGGFSLSKKISPLVGDDRAKWNFRGSLIIGPVEIFLTSDKYISISDKLTIEGEKPKYSFMNTLKHARIAGVCLSAAILGYLAFTFMRAMPVQEAHASSLSAAVSTEKTLSDDPYSWAEIDSKQFEHAFKTSGFKPENIISDNGILRAEFNVRNMEEKAILERLTRSTEARTQLKVTLDQEIMSAASIVVDAMKADASIDKIDRGVIQVSGLADDQSMQERLKMALMADVSGVRDVQFTGAAKEQQLAMLENVIGVWTGQHPYVALSDGKKIRAGQELAPGVELVTIKHSNLLEVRRHGKTEELKLQ